MAIKAVIFDLDGTLFLGDKAIEGAVETITVLERDGYRVFYLTNNSGKSWQSIINKLVRLGFAAHARNTYCGSYAIAAYLTENNLVSVFAVGSDGLLADLMRWNLKVLWSSNVAAVVVGLDLDFSYSKITTALRAIHNGAKLVVANVDANYPAGDGEILPGCGAMVGAIVGATGHAPDFHVGKPNAYMLELLCKEHGLSPDEICVVGDVPESDIAMADNFGCQGILFDPEDVYTTFSGAKVKWLFEIIPLLKNQERRTRR